MRRSLSDFQVGEPFGRYELLFPVAEGGMSRVWAARLRGTRGFQKVVALKTLLAGGTDGHALEQMLLDEARHAALIQHPNVAQYLDVGEQEGVLFLVMEWLDGESLSGLIKNARRTCGIPLGVAIEIAAQACKGLHAAHELKDSQGNGLGLVHCDVSPQNIVLTSSGVAKLIDFGVARATTGAAQGTNIVTGKMSFMAPEQIRGRDFDRRADLFSLGIVLYLLSTGQHPFPGSTPREIMNRIRVGESLRPPSQLVAGFPRELERVILCALSHSPNDRFSTAAEMGSALMKAVPERAEEHELASFVERVCSFELESKRNAITRALAASPADSQEYALASAPPSSRRLSLKDPHSVSSTLPATAVTQPIPNESLKPRRGKLIGAALFLVAACGGFFASQFDHLRLPFSTPSGGSAPALAARPMPATKPTPLPVTPSEAAAPALPPTVALEALTPEPSFPLPAAKSKGAARKAPSRARPSPASRPSPPAVKRPKASASERESSTLQRYGI
jgi:serine/threonine-protein kinase